jgi:hypothetical protein
MSKFYTNKYKNHEIEEAFNTLGISFTLDSTKINSAWKSKAILCHPDKAKSEIEKNLFHNNFIHLIKSRDICLSIISTSHYEEENIEEVNERDFKNEDSIFSNSQSNEKEWESFVSNETRYFSSKEYLRELISSFLNISFHSIIVSILITISGLEIIFILLGIFSKAPALPPIVWFIIPSSLLFLLFYLYKYLSYLDLFILKRLTQTGYPFKYYISLWVIENLFYIILFFLDFNEAIYIFLIGNLGFLIQFQRIKNKIQNIEEIIKKQSENRELR